MTQNQQLTVVITGASSGVGLYAAKALAQKNWHVVMACRDLAKAEGVAQSVGIPREAYSLMQIDLGSLASVRAFVDSFRASGKTSGRAGLQCRDLHAAAESAALQPRWLRAERGNQSPRPFPALQPAPRRPEASCCPPADHPRHRHPQPGRAGR